MAIQEMVLENNGKGFLPSNRTLGALGMILSPMLVVALFFYTPQTDRPNPFQIWASLGGVLYMFGVMTTATALRRLRATGSGAGAAILYAGQMIGLFLAMWCDILEYAAPQLKESILFSVTDLAYPFSHLLMIVVGAAIVRARVWHGWRRIPAFLTGFGLPLFFALIAIVGRENGGFIFPLLVTTGFFLLGLAVFTSKTEN